LQERLSFRKTLRETQTEHMAYPDRRSLLYPAKLKDKQAWRANFVF
jgi:hypothetical protein